MTEPTITGEAPEVLPAPGGEAGPAAPAVGDLDEDEQKRRKRRLLILFLLLGLLAILLGLAIWYLLFRQPLPVLPGIPDTQVPGYSTSIYGVNRPVGVAVSASGDRIYVAESEGDQVVRIFDAGGTEIGTMAPPPETGASHVPVYVAIDPLTEEVYVTDRPTGSIYIYDRAGTYQRQFVPADSQGAWQPLGIAFDAAGTLYVTDLAGTPRVVVFDRAGKVVRVVGEDEDFSFPNGVALDGGGNLYVTDSNNGRLLVFDPAGKVVARIGRGVDAGKLGLPRGVAVDGSEHLFVVDVTGQGAHVFRTFRESDRLLEFLGGFGTQGIGDGEFSYPNGVAVDGRGRIYVTDSGNDRVQVWSY